jgi:hypothetical protein
MCSPIARTTLRGLADRPPVGTFTQMPRNEKGRPEGRLLFGTVPLTIWCRYLATPLPQRRGSDRRIMLEWAPTGVRHMLSDPTWRIEESRRLIEQSLTLLAMGRLQVAKSRALIANSSRVCAVIAPGTIVSPASEPLADQLVP